MVDNLPADILRILSYHGPVAYTVGAGDVMARGTAATAPFEDTIYLLIPVGSPAEGALLRRSDMRLTARDRDGKYDLRMSGRASAGQPLSRTPRRLEIGPWAPEGADPRRLLAIPFVAENVELHRGDDDVRQRHFGLTPAGKARPGAGAVWGAAALAGQPAWFAVLLTAGLWGWLALQGPEWPLRPVALAVGVGAGLALLMGARLAARTAAFGRWRQGRGPAEEAGPLPDGLLAPGQTRAAAGWLAGIGLALLVVAAAGWGAVLAGLSVGLSGVWLLAPAWAVHLSSAREADD